MSKRKGVGDVHTHQLNGDALPDNLSKTQSKGLSEGFLRSFLGKIAGRLAYGSKWKKFATLMATKNLMEVAKIHLQEMDDAGVDYSIVLALDFSEADPEFKGYNLEYPEQMKQLADIAAAYPFRFLPFFFFDPRRPGVTEMLENAYENQGITGIKIYPAYGYDPRPGKKDFMTKRTDLDVMNANLEFLYQFAQDHDLPILTHVSPGGSYRCTVDKKEKYKRLYGYTEPSNFLEVLKQYRLRICLAHYGGSIDKKDIREIAIQWRNQVYNLVRYAADDGINPDSRFFTDQSNLLSHMLKHEERVREHLADTGRLLEPGELGKYLLFGSDWPLARFVINLKEYTNHYKNALPKAKQEMYFSDNIVEFLYGPSRKIRTNYIDFLKKRNGGIETPDWVEERNGEYFMV